jgi:hypothetical protein
MEEIPLSASSNRILEVKILTPDAEEMAISNFTANFKLLAVMIP